MGSPLESGTEYPGGHVNCGSDEQNNRHQHDERRDLARKVRDRLRKQKTCSYEKDKECPSDKQRPAKNFDHFATSFKLCSSRITGGR
jgi:hypothetical protein